MGAGLPKAYQELDVWSLHHDIQKGSPVTDSEEVNVQGPGNTPAPDTFSNSRFVSLKSTLHTFSHPVSFWYCL